MTMINEYDDEDDDGMKTMMMMMSGGGGQTIPVKLYKRVFMNYAWITIYVIRS